MPSPRIFTEAELNLARSMRGDSAYSWRAIGRELRCDAETIRCAIDPGYAAERMSGISERRRERNAKAKAAAAVKEARSASAYQPSRAGSSHHPRRIGSVARVTNLRGFV